MNKKPEISEDQIRELLLSDEKVMEFVSTVKWADGFNCRFCGHSNFCAGRLPYSRRCTRCKKTESATANTLFHNLKFPLHKAFFIARDVCQLQNDVSSAGYAEKLGINPMTCWKFRRKIEACRKRLPPGAGWSQILLLSPPND